jgi:hypothetical protein
VDKLKVIEDRAFVAMAYWLDCSPHEWTVEDGMIIAQYARLAAETIEQYKLQETNLLERLKKQTWQIKEMKQNSRLLTFYAMAEENLKFAEENARLKELVKV